MSFNKNEWPEIGDLVLTTVESIAGYGAYVTLDEYDKKGLLHISEISSSWIRNIRNFVRENQKVVLKVLRVDVAKDHIDVSLRRVNRRERISKIKSFKMERKADALLRNVAEKMNMSFSEVYAKAGILIENEYGLYEGLERVVATENIQLLTKLGIPDDLAQSIFETAKERIRLSLVKVKGIVNVTCNAPDGVKIIQKAFLKAQRSKKDPSISISFVVVAVPKYSIEVMAENYKSAEGVFQKIGEKIISTVVKAGGKGTLTREK